MEKYVVGAQMNLPGALRESKRPNPLNAPTKCGLVLSCVLNLLYIDFSFCLSTENNFLFYLLESFLSLENHQYIDQS